MLPFSNNSVISVYYCTVGLGKLMSYPKETYLAMIILLFLSYNYILHHLLKVHMTRNFLLAYSKELSK